MFTIFVLEKSLLLKPNKENKLMNSCGSINAIGIKHNFIPDLSKQISICQNINDIDCLQSLERNCEKKNSKLC